MSEEILTSGENAEMEQTDQIEAGAAPDGTAADTAPADLAVSPRLVSSFADVVGRHGLGQALGYLGSRRDRRYRPLAQRFVERLTARINAAGFAIDPPVTDCAGLLAWLGSVDGITNLAATVEASAALGEIYKDAQAVGSPAEQV